MRFRKTILVCAALAAVRAEAQAPAIHMGLTAPELAAILAPLGWIADPAAGAERHALSLRHRETGRWLTIDLGDCDAAHRCATGHLHTTTYFTVSPDFAWHWNQENRGAVAFGASHASLMRPLHFRGVTDLYLREAIAAWTRAEAAFWRDAMKSHEDRERRRARP